MVRAWAILLGIGLFILGIAGLNTPGSIWIGWFDIVAGIISFYVGAASAIAAASGSTVDAVEARPYSNVGGVFFLCVGLFALWIAGLATKSATAAMAWWNFGFACAYGLLAISSVRRRSRMAQVPLSSASNEERDQQGPRRVA